MMRLTLPYLDEDEVREVAKVLATGYLTQGPKVAEFEEKIANLISAKHAFAMSSCTTALHLALVALGIGKGDEVLVADFTFPATANVVVQQGARPILVDVHRDTYCIDVDELERRITPATRAIIPVHAFGLPASMSDVIEVANRHGVSIIEDAACALGAKLQGQACGTFGDIGCFSFHPRKSITTGEGGLIATNDDVLAERIRILRNHGGSRSKHYYRFDEAGYNYRMSDVQAALGVAQFRKFDWILNRRREFASHYSTRLSNVEGITPPIEPQGSHHTYQSYVVVVDLAYDRDQVIEEMRRRDIETTLGTYALHEQPFFQNAYGYESGDLPNSSFLFRQTLTLPLYPQMTSEDIDQVVQALGESLENARR
jgi:perosamine synthetase